MKIERQKGKFIISLTSKELEKISSEFEDLITLRDEFDPSENGPRAVKLAALIDGLSNTK